MVLKESKLCAESDSKSERDDVNLQRRVTIFVIVMVTALSALLGVLLIQQNFNQAINQISNEIRTIITAVDATTQDKATTALSYGRDAQVPLSIYISDRTSPPSPIVERDLELSDARLTELSKHVILGKVTSDGAMLLGAVGIEGESQFLIVASTQRPTDQRNRAFLTLLGLLVLISIAMFVALRLVVARDIVRERELIETAERLKGETERRKLLIDFAGDASHELRTPLTVIKGYLELGKNSSSTLNNPETINRLLQESNRMERTISQLLEVFEIESLPSINLKNIDLSKYLNNKLEILKETNPKRDVTGKIEGELKVLANEELLEKIFGNLISNIYRHTKEDVAVQVHAARERSLLTIIVEDAGPGIKDAENARLFSRFDKSRSRSSGGSGLGLSILGAAVSKLGGEVEFGSSTLGGLKVTLTLPAISD